LKHKNIKLPDGKVLQLEKPQRYQLLKILFKSTKYSEEFKIEQLQKEKEIKFSDYDILEELGCFASLHKDEHKLSLLLSYAGLSSLPKDGKFTPSAETNKFNVK